MMRRNGSGLKASLFALSFLGALGACEAPATTPDEAVNPPAIEAPETVSSPSLDDKLANPDDFLTLYPNVYSDHERERVEAYLADNAAIKARGPVNIDQLIEGTLPEGTPGIGPVVKVSPEWVAYSNAKYDWENQLRTNREYAQNAGYADILALPAFGAHDDSFMTPYPPQARDTLLVSDLNHAIINYEPIYPGDTLYMVANSRDVEDLTPAEGSKYRTIAIETRGHVYNQRGQLVNDVVFRVTESVKVYKDDKRPEGPVDFFQMWEAPDWMSRKEHVYTDADWQTLKSIWENETRQGATPLYWEDVNIGDRPVKTADGPIMSSVAPVPPWGLGKGGSRTLKAEFLASDNFDGFVRNDLDGIYRPADESVMILPAPERPSEMAPLTGPFADGPPEGGINTIDIHKDAIRRSPLINYMGREFAIRHLGNWMGDAGWLKQIKWSIMEPRSHWDHGKHVPVNPKAERFLHLVPSLNGKYVTTHGLTKDAAIVQSEVVKKYTDGDDHLVDLVWWIETINGEIWEEGLATIKLPSREG